MAGYRKGETRDMVKEAGNKNQKQRKERWKRRWKGGGGGRKKEEEEKGSIGERLITEFFLCLSVTRNFGVANAASEDIQHREGEMEEGNCGKWLMDEHKRQE